MPQTKWISPLARRAAAAFMVWLIVLCQSPALASEGTAVTIGTGIPEKPKAEVAVRWDDAWFTGDAAVYQQDLALTSMALSGAAYAKKDVQDALKALGFEKIESYHYLLADMTGEQAAYTFGVKQASKEKTAPLIAVVVRGTGDYTEWASNLDMGDKEDHEGFAKAAAELQKNLEQYLKKLEITAKSPVKILLTGHSRGAAVANLAAARLPEGGSVKKENVYAYTFAAPTVSKEAVKEGYENIFNIISEHDLVTQVPLAAWGYRRYGVDLLLPTSGADEALLEAVNQQFKALTGQDYVSYHDPAAVEKMTSALYRLIPTTAGVHMKMFSTLLSGDFKGLSGLVRQNSLAALLMGKTAMEVTSQLTPLLQNEGGALRSGHCMAGYYCWLSVAGDLSSS